MINRKICCVEDLMCRLMKSPMIITNRSRICEAWEVSQWDMVERLGSDQSFWDAGTRQGNMQYQGGALSV